MFSARFLFTEAIHDPIFLSVNDCCSLLRNDKAAYCAVDLSSSTILD